jgi:predicted GNAT superfamily acetyltransferase
MRRWAPTALIGVKRSTIVVYRTALYVLPRSKSAASHPTLSTHHVPPDAARPAATNPHAGAVAHAGPGIVVRSLDTLDELRECVALQHEVWGKEYDDAVPASLLHVVTQIGGIVAGAFSADDELVGFVFGISGIKNGEVVHWSHELGVRASARDAGVGRMLKQFQRTELARLGISTMFWTFDPLMAKNAHLNLNRLGARVVEYVENMYGTTGSPLHHGLATDRLVVSWSTSPDTNPTPAAAQATIADIAPLPILSAEPRAGDVRGEVATNGKARAPVLLLEVPTDIQRTPGASRAAWQASLRASFERALGSGYIVTGLHRDAVASRSFYVLELRTENTP